MTDKQSGPKGQEGSAKQAMGPDDLRGERLTSNRTQRDSGEKPWGPLEHGRATVERSDSKRYGGERMMALEERRWWRRASGGTRQDMAEVTGEHSGSIKRGRDRQTQWLEKRRRRTNGRVRRDSRATHDHSGAKKRAVVNDLWGSKEHGRGDKRAFGPEKRWQRRGTSSREVTGEFLGSKRPRGRRTSD